MNNKPAIYEIHDRKLCPLRHAIVPGKPSLIPGEATLEFKDIPCAQDNCAWWTTFSNPGACAITDVAASLDILRQRD